MKPLFGYLFLAVGIFAGIAANSFAKISEGFTKTFPIIYMYLLMMVCLFCIAKAMHALPVVFDKLSRDYYSARLYSTSIFK